MASVSYSMTRGNEMDDLSTGVQSVTEGTSAPGAGDIEVRINIAQGWTKLEVKRALANIVRFFEDVNRSQALPL